MYLDDKVPNGLGYQVSKFYKYLIPSQWRRAVLVFLVLPAWDVAWSFVYYCVKNDEIALRDKHHACNIWNVATSEFFRAVLCSQTFFFITWTASLCNYVCFHLCAIRLHNFLPTLYTLNSKCVMVTHLFCPEKQHGAGCVV